MAFNLKFWKDEQKETVKETRFVTGFAIMSAEISSSITTITEWVTQETKFLYFQLEDFS